MASSAAQGFCLYVLGRLRGITRERLTGHVQRTGGWLARSPTRRVDVVALGHRSAATTLVGAPPLTLPKGIPDEAELISERTLYTRLGLLPASSEHREFTGADIERRSGLSLDTLRCLALCDVLDPAQERYSFRDLRAAREAARLVAAGYTLAEIVEAAALLRVHGRGLFDTTLGEAPWGEVMQVVGPRISHLNGQYALALEGPCETLDEAFARAEECEGSGDLGGAERWYRMALLMDHNDPVIPFNLGNILDAQDRPAEAVVYYWRALECDATFADAWVNIAAVHERRGRLQEAEMSLRHALASRPGDDLALYNLARLLTRQSRYTEALPLWDEYLACAPPPPDLSSARRLSALCRLSLVS